MRTTELLFYTGEEGQFRVKLGSFLMGMVVISGIIGIAVAPPLSIFSLPLLAGGFYLRQSGERFLKWYIGEVRVLEVLEGINGCTVSDVVLHDGGNIDHVFISERGVFAIEVKNCNTDVMVNGDNWGIHKSAGWAKIKSISKATKAQALELSRFIERSTGQKIFVKPVIVFTGSGTVIGKSTVPILTPDTLKNFILEEKRSLDQKIVEEYPTSKNLDIR